MTISAYRTVTWRPSLAGQLAAPPLAWPNKMPADVADFTLDIGLYLANPVDTVASCSVFTLATGMTFSAVAVAGGLLTTTISGGSLGLTYPVDFVVVTAGGQTIDFRVLMPIGPGASRTQATYVPSIATATTPGLVRPGNNVTVSPDGAISFTGGGSSLPATGGLLATTGTAGVAGAATAAQVGAASVIATGGSISRTIADRFATTFNVLDYGAVADGTTDLAIALRAIAAIMSPTTANIIDIPSGGFAQKSGVTFNGVAPIIRGQGFTAGTGSTGTGTRITISGTGYTPFTFTGTNASGAIVRDISIGQVQPTPGAGWAPTAYDYVFRVQDCLGEVTFDNVLFSGVTKGIFCDNSGRLRIRGITGQFFQNAVSISHCLDIPRIDNIHSWPYWSTDSNVLAYQRDNLDVVTFKRCDGVFIGNLFGYCGKRLIYITSDTAAPTGTLTRGFVNSMYADGFKYSIYADSDSADFMVSNLSHQGFDPNNGTTPITGGSALVLTGSFCQVMVTNFFTDIAGTSPVVVQGAGNYLWFNSFSAVAFQSTGTGTPAIAVTTNAVPNSVSIANTPRLRGTLPLTLMNSPAVVLTNRPLMQQEAGGPSVNELRGYTGLSGSGSARLGATGGDTNINLDLNPQGAGAVRILGSAGYVVFRADDGNSAMGATGLLMRPASTEYQVIVEGAATAANLSFYPKGASGSVRLKGGYGYPVVDVDDANNALGASSLLLRSGGGGGEFQIIGIGTAANSDINIYPKGAGVLKVNGTAVPLTTYSLPTASTTVLGGVKVDGTTVTISGAGVISAAGSYTLPTATSLVLGGVKPDGTSITNTAGAISVTFGTTAGTAAQGNDSRITGALPASTAATTYLALSGGTLTGGLTGTTATMSGAIQGTTLTGTTSVVASGTNSITMAGAASGPVTVKAGGGTNVGIALIPIGTGAITLQVPDNTATGGNARGAGAVDFTTSRDIASRVASGSNSFAVGIYNTASGARSFVGGESSSSTNTNSFAFGQSTNATGQASIAVGNGANAGALGAVALGGGVTASATYAVALGQSSNATANTAVAIGWNVNATGVGSFANGNSSNDRGRYGALVFASGQFSTSGDGQEGKQILRASTTATSSARLTADQAAAGVANVFNIPNNTAYTIGALIVTGRDTTTGDAATWYLATPATLLRKATVGTTALVSAITMTAGANSGGGSLAGMAVPTVVADTTNGGLNISVTPGSANATHFTARIVADEIQ